MRKETSEDYFFSLPFSLFLAFFFLPSPRLWSRNGECSVFARELAPGRFGERGRATASCRLWLWRPSSSKSGLFFLSRALSTMPTVAAAKHIDAIWPTNSLSFSVVFLVSGSPLRAFEHACLSRRVLRAVCLVWGTFVAAAASWKKTTEQKKSTPDDSRSS